MTTATVTTQAELDAALDRTDLDEIIITSSAGVWLELNRPGSASVTAYVAAPLVDLRPISADKAKTRSVRVLAEVDIHATDLTPANA